MLGIVEIDADNRIAATVVFDPDDIDAAFEELDARYLAGEAAPTRTHGRLSLEATPHSIGANCPRPHQIWSIIDHRRVAAFAPGDMMTYLRAGWDLSRTITSMSRLYIG